jgi:hypothetical protein
LLSHLILLGHSGVHGANRILALAAKLLVDELCSALLGCIGVVLVIATRGKVQETGWVVVIIATHVLLFDIGIT